MWLAWDPTPVLDASFFGDPPVDESVTSLAMIVSLGATLGILGGTVALFFGCVLWNSIEEVPDEDDSEAETA